MKLFPKFSVAVRAVRTREVALVAARRRVTARRTGSATEATGLIELTETRTGTESMAGIPGTGTENAVARGNATERG